MKTVNKYEPRHDCFACCDGKCQILKDTYCTREEKCRFHQTQAQLNASIKKAEARLCAMGVEPKLINKKMTVSAVTKTA